MLFYKIEPILSVLCIYYNWYSRDGTEATPAILAITKGPKPTLPLWRWIRAGIWETASA